MHGRKIELGNLAFPDPLVHIPQRCGVFGGDDHAAGVPVDTIAKRRGKGLLGGGIVFALAIKIGLDMQNERVLSPVGVLVHQHAGALVENHQIFIFKHNRKLGADGAKRAGIALIGRVEKFVLYKKADLVPFGQKRVARCAFAVEFDLFGAQILIKQRERQAAHSLEQEFIQPLSRIVFPDRDNLHIFILQNRN